MQSRIAKIYIDDSCINGNMHMIAKAFTQWANLVSHVQEPADIDHKTLVLVLFPQCYHGNVHVTARALYSNHPHVVYVALVSTDLPNTVSTQMPQDLCEIVRSGIFLGSPEERKMMLRFIGTVFTDTVPCQPVDCPHNKVLERQLGDLLARTYY